MNVHAVRWTVGGVLLAVALMVGKTSFSAIEEKEEKIKAIAAAKAAVLDLAGGKGDPKEIAKKHELEYVMVSFKSRDKGGIGLGATPGAIKPDGIESKIQALAKTKLSGEELKTQSPDLIKMLEITRAIGDVNAFYPDPAKKNPKLWKQYNEDMIKASKNLQEMIKGGDPAKVKSGANKLSATCNDCHKEFRDDS